MKRIISVILTLALALSLAPAVLAADVVASGSCGDNITWELDSDGTLRISGYGPMYDYEWYAGGPWNNQSVEARKAILSDEITSIGSYAFYVPFTANIRLEEVNIPTSCTRIGKDAFAGCTSLLKVFIPIRVTAIEAAAFCLCESLRDVYYEGTKEQWANISIDDGNEWLTEDPVLHFADKPALLPYQPSDWAKEEVDQAISLGLVSGEIQDYRQPITRLDTVKLATNLLEKINGTTIDGLLLERGLSTSGVAFDDTRDIRVLSTSALGIINGMGEGKFAPQSTLTRAQAAAIINRIANVQGIVTDGYTQSFSDTTNHWVASELGWPVANSIIKGMGDGKFAPDNQLTIEQAIVLIYRAYRALM